MSCGKVYPMYLDPKTRATSWSVTAFFDTPKTPSKQTREYQIDEARRKGWVVEGQVEKCPETGNLHYQMLVKTPQTRASALMGAFPQAEIQVARNVSALQTYVHKDETRVEEMKKVSVAITWTNVCDKFFLWVIEYGEAMVVDHERRLQLWDQFIEESIGEGIMCDLIGVNPQYRSCIMKYWTGYVRRQNRQIDKDMSVDNRQTDSQEVSLPMVT